MLVVRRGRFGKGPGRQNYWGYGTGGVAPVAAVALDPVITTAMLANTQDAFGFDRWVQSYGGMSARFQRADTQQSDFGFNAVSGRFDLAGLIAWAGGAATLVRLYSQKGTGKTLDANTATSIPVIVDGTYKTFATDEASDGQLTFNQNGGLGVVITGGAYLHLASSGYSGASMEVHVLNAPLARKKATATADATELAATNTSEAVFSYGTSATNYIHFVYGGGTGSAIIRRNGSAAGGTDQQLTLSATTYIKKNGQMILSVRNSGTEISTFTRGLRRQTVAPSAGNITASASLDNGQFRIGAAYGGSSPGNMLFGGCAITTAIISAAEQSYIHSTMNLIGQQHNADSRENVLALFDELIDMRDVDSNGLVPGRMGKAALQFNKLVGSPAWNFAAITAQGWQGIRSTSAVNVNNTYTLTSDYFTDVLSGSMMAVCVNENTDINQTFSLRNPADTSDFSLGLGRHHTQPNMQRGISASKDTQGWSRHLHSTESADAGGGKISQAMAKYQFNLAHGDWTPNLVTTGDIVSTLYGVTIPTGATLTTAAAATVGWFPPLPEHVYADQVDLKFTSSPGEMLYHIATFQKGPLYNPADPEATRRPYMRTGTTWSYLAHHNMPIGHRDGAVAREIGTGSIVESDSTFRIMSNTYQGVVNMGTHLFWGFAKVPWTRAQAEKIQANLYKFVYFGYT